MNRKLLIFSFLLFSALSVKAGVEFDGTTGYIRIAAPSFSQLTTQTWSFWIKPDTGGGGNLGRIIHLRDNVSGLPSIVMANSSAFGSQTIRFEYGATGNFVVRVAVSSTIVFGLWNHVSVSYNGSTLTTVDPRIFVNGVEVAINPAFNSTTGTPNPTLATGSVYIGNRSDGIRTFDGTIDDVRVYNRILSDAELESLGKAQTRLVITDGLVAWWKLDEQIDGATAQGATALDSSGNGNTGSGSGGPDYRNGILNYP